MNTQPYTTLENARIVPLSEALAQYQLSGLDHYMLEGLKGNIYIFDEDAHFDSLDLDKLFYSKNDCGALFRANLNVDTYIIQPEIDYGPFIYVHGNTTARNIYLGGGYIHFHGDVTVEQTLVGGTYNHGMSRIEGLISAEVITSNDHGFDYKSANIKKGFLFINDQSENTPPYDPADVLNKRFWDQEEGSINTGNIFKSVKKGESILKPNAGTSPITKRLEKAVASKAKRADLSKLKLKRLPQELFIHKDLKQIKLSYNPITDFSEELASLPQLNTLELVECELEVVPEVISKLSTLETLDLSDNLLTTLPDSFAALQQLKKLSLRGCYIKETPAVLKDLPKLEILDLEYQREDALLTIDGGFSALKELHLWGELNAPLPKLERLHLRRRALLQLPEALKESKKLKTLDISPSVQLEALPEWLADLQQLEDVALFINKRIQNIEVLSKLPKLKTLRILHDGHGIPTQIYQLMEIPHWTVLYIRSFDDSQLLKAILDRPDLTKLVRTSHNGDEEIDIEEGRRWLGLTI